MTITSSSKAFSTVVADQMSIDEVTEQGIDMAEDGADAAWFAAALDCLYALAESRTTFTSDHVWQRMEVYYPSLTTRNGKAMGAIFRKASKNGWIKGTENYTPTKRKQGHKRPIMIWESNLLSQ